MKIYADESKRRFIPDLLGRFIVPDSIRWQIQYISSDDLLKQAPISSECVFLTPDLRELHFPLKEIDENMELMSIFNRSYGNTTSLPLADTLKLSDRIFFETGHNEVLLGDYLLGGLYAFKLTLSDTLHAKQIILGEQLKRAYLDAIGQSMTRYDSLALLLKAKGMDGIAVTNANWCSDTLYLYANIHYPDKMPEDTSMVMIQNYPVFFKMVADTVFDWRRCD